MADPKELSVIEGSFSMVPRNLTEAMEFSKLIANSEICPTQFKGKAGDVLVAVQMGMEVGLKPLQAIQNIAVINGRPTMWGDAVKGLVEASGQLEYCVETWDPKTKTATCRGKRKNRPEAIRTFSMEDAKKAGLDQKDTYKKYEARMCQMRARSYFLRDDFADVLKGLAVREEVEDFQPIATAPDGTQVAKAPPRRKSETAAAPATPSGDTGATDPAPSATTTHEPIVTPDASPETSTPEAVGEIVTVISATERAGGGKTFYSVDFERDGGSRDSASTFDKGIYETALALVSQQAALVLVDGKKINPKTNRPYQNIATLTAADVQR